MERRNFVKNIGAGALLLGMGGISFALGKKEIPAKNYRKHITILHTNDTHSHIDPLPVDDPHYPDKGGVARRAVLINQVRKENPNTLLFDAGDIFQGTPYFNYYGGELEFRLMSMLKYDAATFGNHDFDNGLEGLLSQLPHAKFDFINSNYDFKDTILEGKAKPYKVFVVDEVRVGVYGLGVELKGLVTKENYRETKYLDPIELAIDMENKLKKNEKCDIIICLSHLGYQYRTDKVCDITIAKRTYNTDLIIGGHTHTFLGEPTIVKNKSNREILVNQVGCYGINLGRIDFYLDNKITSSGTQILV
ncbi:metallophosphatase [Capnocytophaga gingivalis]|jgi:putative 5-nucleotidase|uniref:metallophosphatase n=1 Tax=Capnocytophaga gingivalis TaxID=1017 RepID=UPI00019F9FD2|nr:metallophosphatase [Capnocytophaga gingivalis]EEK13444.1 Tat pathway signal sequence domain protein [Capnocytophaga gingivalis ATCC 33624]MEB3013009.1 metallophosphatase [Capnocytophaga gingivalis]